MDEARKARMDMIDACHKRWECRSMEIELAQASAKLVEQQNEIERLRAEIQIRVEAGTRMVERRDAEIERLRRRVKHLEDVLADQSWSREYDRTMGVDYNESY